MSKDNPSVPWSKHPDDWDLLPDRVDVWRVFLDASTPLDTSLSTDPADLFESTLSADEKHRAARFVFPQDRRRFVLSHGHMRGLLARYLDCEPELLEFGTNEYGKPGLANHSLEFNLSHSGDFALLAVSHQHKVGVDVERIRQDMEFKDLAHRFFSESEYSELMDMLPEQRTAAFFRCWTLKEAYIKAQGLGLSLPLDGFDVSLSSNERPILRATRPNQTEASRWTLLSFDVDSEYTGAVAVESTTPKIRFWDWAATQER